MMRSLNTMTLLLAALSLLSSCDRRPLEVYSDGVAAVRIEVDWEKYFPEEPTGMTVQLAKDGDDVTHRSMTNDTRSQTFLLGTGTYRLLVFNQSFTEFGSMSFTGTESHHDLTAHAEPMRTRTPKTWDEGTAYMQDPEPIGVAVDTFTVTPDMTDGQLRFVDYRRRFELEGTDTTVTTIREEPRLMVSTLNVRVRVRGYSNMRGVEARITGMADGFSLAQTWRNETSGTLLLSHWYAQRDTAATNAGWVTTRTSTFGLPHGKEREANRLATDNVVTLCFTLIDGSERLFAYDVGKFIRYRSDTGDAWTQADVTLDLDLTLDVPFLDDDDTPLLPDVEPDKQGAGFDATVDPWEEGATIPIGV